MTDERIARFYDTIYTTDEELLDLQTTEQLRSRLRILRDYRAPLSYRVAVKDALALRELSGVRA